VKYATVNLYQTIVCAKIANKWQFIFIENGVNQKITANHGI